MTAATIVGSCDTAGGGVQRRDAIPDGVGTYPGGKSGSGIYQRLINLIPRHRILISAFAGHCGVTRHIRPAEQTIVIDRDETVCQWWSDWCRTKHGRRIEIHHCDSIEWLRHWFGLTQYSATGSGVVRSQDTGSRNYNPGNVAQSGVSRARHHQPPEIASPAEVAESGVAAGTRNRASEAFLFCDPPYVLSERSHGKQYRFEMTDSDHERLLRILTQISATTATAVMLCGYRSQIYKPLDGWLSIDHLVMTRGGLQDEAIWMNYEPPEVLHDYRHIGHNRRERERIQRRQRNWRKQLEEMPPWEIAAMLEALSRSANQ